VSATKAEPRPNRVARAAAALLVLGGVSCAHLPFFKPKASEAEARLGESGLTVNLLQTEVLRFADNYVTSVAAASDALAAGVGSRDVMVRALKWKLGQANAAYADATGENPVWNALDLTVLAMVSRMVVTHPDVRREFGPAADPLVATHQDLEKSAWALARTFLTAEQVEELKNLVEEWRRANPNERSVTGARFREFAINLGKYSPTGARNKPTSIFSMLYLDPFAGLDPTTVAIDQSRELAERVVAYAERLPTLVRWQAELLALQVAQQPAAQDISSDLGRTSRAIDSISKTAEGIPALVDAQRAGGDRPVLRRRDAAARGVAGGARLARRADPLAARRAARDDGRGRADGRLSDGHDPDARRLRPVRLAAEGPNAPPSTGKPFDPLDYGMAASQVGSMARDLNTLLASAGSTAPGAREDLVRRRRRPQARGRPRVLDGARADRRLPGGLRGGAARVSVARAAPGPGLAGRRRRALTDSGGLRGCRAPLSIEPSVHFFRRGARIDSTSRRNGEEDSMKRALVLRAVAALCLVFAAAAAQAQFPGNVPDTFRLNLGGMYAWFNTEVTLEAAGAGGPRSTSRTRSPYPGRAPASTATARSTSASFPSTSATSASRGRARPRSGRTSSSGTRRTRSAPRWRRRRRRSCPTATSASTSSTTRRPNSA
jgi:hypothetical protein